MVSVLGLFLKALPLLQHLSVGERYPVDSLERLHVRAAFPVRGGVLDDKICRERSAKLTRLYTKLPCDNLTHHFRFNITLTGIILQTSCGDGVQESNLVIQCSWLFYRIARHPDTHLIDLQCFDLARMPYMRASAQVNERATSKNTNQSEPVQTGSENIQK